ncbi:SpoIIE family protein phosphatase [Streptomyces chiangmaiensis]|uniref:SpoIIE family protein phosphatase n=1 Tax=Streptomyces chiangmaiensis TaxID=766497 RepID=A0ABU7FBW7_9ACTN|nr:SpoIIE family protein phosphatase [Streptomyces chiangmaiensis]MED7821461.1 SpoIIE family protein phosphatase [Streptomyces chiangmaiensis]
MRGSAERVDSAPGTPTAVLTGAVTDAIRAVGGFAGGVYLRSSTPAVLRLAVLAGLPGPLFRPWARLHMDRQLPVADAYRLRKPVVLTDATDTMRRYPQLAAELPFRFASVYVPVVGGTTVYGVLTVLWSPAPDSSTALPHRDRVTAIADRLGDALGALDDGVPVHWDAEPLGVRPPAHAPPQGFIGHFVWDPADSTVTADATFWDMTGGAKDDIARSPEALAAAISPDDAHLVLCALRETASGSPPSRPLGVRAENGGHLMLEFWTEGSARREYRVGGLVIDPGTGPAAQEAGDLLPDGVFAFDRLGLITYANPRAADLLGRPQAELVGRALWDAVPWLDRPAYEDHLRAALIAPEPVHFQVRHPTAGATDEIDGDWLTLSVYPGADVLTCRIVPLGHTEEAPSIGESAVTTAGALTAWDAPTPAYRPIILAIALSEAVTARQVSEVVMRELLPAFGGRRLAIYLLQERHLYLAWETGFPPGFLSQFDGVGLDAKLPGTETLTTGRPLFFESMQQLESAYPDMPLDTPVGSRAFLPLIASGRPVGSCVLGFERPRTFSTEVRTVLTALAGLIAQALERARLYDSEAALARGLQEALLPHRLSEHPQVETEVCYLPGTQGMDVGGDWYDVVEAGDGLALVIGDVQGHGVQAAATMGQLRSAVRAFALRDYAPHQVMGGTNRLLIDLDPDQFASCCYIRLDPDTGYARAVRAGHTQPLLRHPDGRAEVLDLPGGLVLGVDPEARYPVTHLRLEPGAVLALYTDGLVEQPGRDIDEGVEALRRALAGESTVHGHGPSLSDIGDRLMERARHATDRPDDIALLLATRRDESPGTRHA